MAKAILLAESYPKLSKTKEQEIRIAPTGVKLMPAKIKAILVKRERNKGDPFDLRVRERIQYASINVT